MISRSNRSLPPSVRVAPRPIAGTRHEVVLEFCGPEAVAGGEELIERLPDHEFALPGQLVADATITKVDHRFGAMERLEVTAVLLLLEEG